MRKDNRGFSLVELIIVMAIMGVLIGGSLIGFGLVNGKPAEECARKIYQNLQSNRTTAMGKYTASLSVYKDGDGVIWAVETVDGVAGVPVKIGAKGVKVEYRLQGDVTWHSLGDAASPLILSYNRSNGSFKDLSEMGVPGAYCVEIRCSKASTVKLIQLYHLTGKVSLE